MKYVLSSIVVLLFLACSNEKPGKAVSRKKGTKLTYALAPANIYISDSIVRSMETANALQKAESRKLFMSGLDLLANKSNALASIEYFKEAIFYYPDEKNYSYLFQAYIQSQQPALADSINRTLFGRIDYPENSYNSALIAAVRKDTSAAIDNLNEAIMQGFVFKDRITNEKLFDFLKDKRSFQSTLLTISGDDEKLRKLLFTAFLKGIPEITLPFEMPVDSSKSFSFDKYIDYDFALFIPGMQDGRFSRDVSNEYQYVGKFKTQNGMGFIYKSFQMIADTLNPVQTNIVLYDSLGKIISNREIGCYCSPIESKGFLINKDLSLDIKTYKIKWEFDPLEKGYAGNKIISTDQTEILRYAITKENMFSEITDPGVAANSGK